VVDLQEQFWEDLLAFIEERRVIPIIGPELVTVRDGEQELPLYRCLGERLAEALELPAAELPEGFELNDVVSLHLRRRGDREELYPRIRNLLRSAAPALSQPLQALARITDFDLFVSLTFDSLLVDALNAARFDGTARTMQVAYSPSDVRDLAAPVSELQLPVVFHLLGRASASPDYAICDDDLLEFLHAMQDRQRQPSTLFDELHKNHLLILGCRFGDWLARFFLRTARNLALSQNRQRKEFLVDSQVVRGGGLALFLESFSRNTQVLPMGPAEFVAELSRRWQAAHSLRVPKREEREGEAGAARVPRGAIFVSYASEDRDAAHRLVEGLRAAELEVWFDKAALKMGDDWARGIRRGIEQCSLFLPVISHQSLSEENRRSYFWKEWNHAHEFASGMAPDEVFIVPVAIDDSRIDRAALPDSFKKAQGGIVQGGQVTAEVAGWLKGLVKDYHRRQRAA